MKILVCIKQVPGTTAVEVDPETGVLRRSGVPGKMNPYDLYAIELALQLRERFGGHVEALTMGPPQAQAVLREAIYMGADGGCLLTDQAFAGADVLATVKALRSACQCIGAFDLIVCGRQTTDGDTAQVGQELAELLGIPHVTNVIAVNQVTQDKVLLQADIGDTLFTLEATLPCLLCVDGGINTPRLPSYRRIFDRGTADLPVLTLSDLADSDPTHYGLKGSPTQVERIFPPLKNDDRRRFTGTGQQLAQTLYDVLVEEKFLEVNHG